MAWLDMLEGYMWRRIRGAGLAYGTGIHADMRRGQLEFYVYRAPNAFAAWNEARKIVFEVSRGEIVINETDLEGAKSSHVYAVVKPMGTNLEAAQTGYETEFLRGLPKDFPIRLLRLAEVSFICFGANEIESNG